MPKGILFWVIMVVWFVFGLIWVKQSNWVMVGGAFVIFCLLFLLGWKVFGFVVQ